MYSIRNSKYTFFYIHFHYKPDRQAGQMTGPRVGGEVGFRECLPRVKFGRGGGLCAGANQGGWWGGGSPPPPQLAGWLAGWPHSQSYIFISHPPALG